MSPHPIAPKKIVAIGFLGTTLDGILGPERWDKWRPTIDLCQQDDLLLHRFELLHQPEYAELAEMVVTDMKNVAPETEIRRTTLDIRDPWDFEEVFAALHDFAHGYPFDLDNEDYLVHITTGTHVAQICLFLLTESRHLPGKLLQTSPPDRSRSQGPGEYRIIDLDLSRYDRIASRFHQERREGYSFLKSGIETRNSHFNRLIEQIEQVAIRSKAPLLLMGPTGAGKSQLARRIYELKKARRQVSGEFVEVNCATVRGDAAMSALFGHKKGAFTGALQDRPGLLRAADGGILFLDEVGELGLDEQAMLLRALEEKRFLPLGADKETESDFQLIAGTNRDLADEVQSGTFREDLYSRINLWTYRLPGLRDRAEDIEPNLEYELEQFARKSGSRVTFSKEAKEHFLKFATSREAKWRANFRDLNAAMSRMATLAPGGRITVEIVNEEIARLNSAWQPQTAEGIEPDLQRLLGSEKLEAIDLFDRLQLAMVVKVCREHSTISDAGRALFSVSRQRKKQTNDADRLRKYLARFGLEWQEIFRGS